MVVLHPQTSDPEALLEAARAWMEGSSEPLTVVILDNDHLTHTVQNWQMRHAALIRPVHLQEATLEQLLQVFTHTGCDGLVVGADLPLLEGAGLERLLVLSRAPVLLVR
jgi:hypothetical protein